MTRARSAGKSGTKPIGRAWLAACLAFHLAGGHASVGLAQESADTGSEIGTEQNATAELQRAREKTRQELDALAETITLSEDKVRTLQQGIDALEKNSASIREALIVSAQRRKDFEARINDSEHKLADLQLKSDRVHESLRLRRGLLAEVLAALQRMGRNPPPALLVTPDDALGSVRSAILLGAVVPGIRKETDRLAADLKSLIDLTAATTAEKASLSTSIASNLEEERRMDLLLAENDKLTRQNVADLQRERQRSEELAGKATNLEGLIASIEAEISSVREAAEAARAEEERRRQMTQEQREKARALAESGVPDKNRIAPAYAFSELKGKLDLPVAGDVIRRFGEADGTGHPARDMVVATSAGAVVTAPADGSVVFAGQFRSFGQVVILNTGDGFHMVLSGMDRITTRQGQFVFAGEPLAVMGAKRVASATALALETDRPTLYIEFRKDGKPVDSRPWWIVSDIGKARNDS